MDGRYADFAGAKICHNGIAGDINGKDIG